MGKIENKEEKLTKETITSAQKIVNGQNNSILKYSMYSRRASLLMELYKEQILENLDFNSVPVSIINELNSLNMMCIILESVLKSFSIDDICFTEDRCLVAKNKVEKYNKLNKQFNYYNNQNAKIITLEFDINYQWNVLSDEDIFTYQEKVKNVVTSEEAEKLICQLELLRHTQPLEISLQILEIRKMAEQKCDLASKNNTYKLTKKNQKPTSTLSTISLLEEDMVETISNQLIEIKNKIKEKAKNNLLVRKLDSLKK